jgi:hypothetical protein
MLDENSEWMPAKALQSQVGRLNSPDDPSPLAIQWEVAVLNALSKYVQITHEPDLGSQPDILFEVNGENVVADVTAVSDRNALRTNPIEDLNEEFLRRIFALRQLGLKGGFGLSVGEMSPRRRGKDKPAPSLRIPKRHRFKAVIFNSRWGEFIRALKRFPNQSHTFQVTEPECELTFAFNPKGSNWTINKVRCDQTTTLKNNPLWNALQEKRGKLAKVKIPAHKGIIICDADCAAIKSKQDYDQYGTDEIIKCFLRRHKSIQFVLVLIPAHKGRGFDLNARNHELHWRLFPERVDASPWLAPIREFPQKIPQIQNNAANARYRADWKRQQGKWNEGPTFRGASTMSAHRIRISARDVLELMAGTLKQEEFLTLHSRESMGSLFLQKLANGQLITASRIEKHDIDSDDDWIVFEFGDVDPAVSRYRVKGQTPGQSASG